MEVTVTMKRYTEKGRLVFLPPEEAGLQEAIKKVLRHCAEKNNDFVTVTLSTPKKPRTTGSGSQNHHLNGHIMQICNETGNDYDSVKMVIKQIAMEQFGFPFQTIAGKAVPKRERDCSTEECAMLIEASHYLAADMGIVLREV